MKQLNLFGKTDFFLDDEKDSIYSTSIDAPTYEPRGKKPDTFELCDNLKTIRLLSEIEESNVSDHEKRFLRFAAYRHCVFNYESVADYYAHASEEMQQLMEKSALVIIDFNSAIKNGYVKVCELINEQYQNEYKQDQ